jgi:hypothetical protein
MTADKLIDQIFVEFSKARKARKLTNVRKHLTAAEWLVIELDETLRFEGIELENIESCDDDMEDEDE